MALIVHVVDGEVRLIAEDHATTSTLLDCKYPAGDVYVRFMEPLGLQWRFLQRSSKIEKIVYFAMLIPINVDQLPECVQVVHMCTE